MLLRQAETLTMQRNIQAATVLFDEDLPREAGDIADGGTSVSVVVWLPSHVADAVSREDERRRHLPSHPLGGRNGTQWVRFRNRRSFLIAGDGLPNGHRFRKIVRLFATSPALRPHLPGAWAFVSDLLPRTFARS